MVPVWTKVKAALFRHPQLGAAGPWILLQLRAARRDGLAGHQPHLGLFAAHAHRKLRRADASPGQLRQRPLDDPVLQRVEGDDGQATAGVQPVHRRPQHGGQGIQFTVDRDPDGLKAPLGRVLLLPQSCGRHGALDDLHQLQGGLHRRGLPRPDDGSRDGGGVPLLAVFKQDAPQLLLAPGVHDVRGAQGGGGVHPHVQRGVLHIGEAP